MAARGIEREGIAVATRAERSERRLRGVRLRDLEDQSRDAFAGALDLGADAAAHAGVVADEAEADAAELDRGDDRARTRRPVNPPSARR